jgi:hypothetical protein
MRRIKTKVEAENGQRAKTRILWTQIAAGSLFILVIIGCLVFCVIEGGGLK